MTDVLLLDRDRGSGCLGRSLGFDDALFLLEIGDRPVMRLRKIVPVLRLDRGILLGLRRLVGIAHRRRGRQLGLHGGERADAQACGERDGYRKLFHSLPTPPQCWICGAAPDLAATLPDLTSSYQYSWC